MRYEVVEHTADIMVKCRGNNLEGCFSNAAYALSDQMVDASTVDPVMTFNIEVSSDDAISRLYAFLSELLFIQDSESVVMSEFDVIFDGDVVRCAAYGEPLNAAKHRMKTEIKGITYHMMDVNEEEPSVTVIFDV